LPEDAAATVCDLPMLPPHGRTPPWLSPPRGPDEIRPMTTSDLMRRQRRWLAC